MRRRFTLFFGCHLAKVLKMVSICPALLSVLVKEQAEIHA